MEPEVTAAVLALVGTIGTLVITNIFNAKRTDKQLESQAKQMQDQLEFQREERNFQAKQAFMNNSYEHRLEAYSTLFMELKKFQKYFELFTYDNLEFTDSLDHEQFAPLDNVSKLNEVYQEKALWITQDSEKAFKRLFRLGYKGCNIALNIHTHKGSDIDFTSAVEPFCKEILKEIKIVQETIREDIGLKYVEEYKEKWNKETALKETAVANE